MSTHCYLKCWLCIFIQDFNRMQLPRPLVYWLLTLELSIENVLNHICMHLLQRFRFLKGLCFSQPGVRWGPQPRDQCSVSLLCSPLGFCSDGSEQKQIMLYTNWATEANKTVLQPSKPQGFYDGQENITDSTTLTKVETQKSPLAEKRNLLYLQYP